MTSEVRLSAYREEFRTRRVGPLLIEVLWRTVVQTARNYPPGVYAEGGVWDRPAYDVVLQLWTEDRLLGKKDLNRVLASAKDADHLRRLLRGSLRRSLSDALVGIERVNLARRTGDILRSGPPFTVIGTQPPAQLVVVGHARDRSRADARELAQIALQLTNAELSVVRVMAGTRAAPILPDAQLARLLEHMLSVVGGPVAIADVEDAVALRFGLTQPLAAGRQEVPDAPSSDPAGQVVDAERHATAHEIARLVGSGLSEDVRATIVAWEEQEERSFAEVGRALGVHPTTVRARLRGVLRQLGEEASAAGLLESAELEQRATSGHTSLDEATLGEISNVYSVLVDQLFEARRETHT